MRATFSILVVLTACVAIMAAGAPIPTYTPAELAAEPADYRPTAATLAEHDAILNAEPGATLAMSGPVSLLAFAQLGQLPAEIDPDARPDSAVGSMFSRWLLQSRALVVLREISADVAATRAAVDRIAAEGITVVSAPDPEVRAALLAMAVDIAAIRAAPGGAAGEGPDLQPLADAVRALAAGQEADALTRERIRAALERVADGLLGAEPSP